MPGIMLLGRIGVSCGGGCWGNPALPSLPMHLRPRPYYSCSVTSSPDSLDLCPSSMETLGSQIFFYNALVVSSLPLAKLK